MPKSPAIINVGDTVTLKGKEYASETFTVESIDTLENLPALKQSMTDAKTVEPVHYYLTRETEGTRKKAYTIPCLRYLESGNFITAL